MPLKPRRPAVNNGAMRCPHCENPAVVRSSGAITRLVFTRRYQCTDLECGHTFVAQLEIVRTLSPSAKPRAGVIIPFGAPRAPAAPAVLPTPANDPLPIEAQA